MINSGIIVSKTDFLSISKVITYVSGELRGRRLARAALALAYDVYYLSDVTGHNSSTNVYHRESSMFLYSYIINYTSVSDDLQYTTSATISGPAGLVGPRRSESFRYVFFRTAATLFIHIRVGLMFWDISY